MLFHIHARMFRGLLCAPELNELQTAETDDYDGAVAQAEELARRGFAVWIYKHQPRAPSARPGDSGPERGYEVVAEWRADGSRRR